MTTFFAPTDLRVVDPRPTATPTEADEETVRELLTARLDGEDLTRALRALGLLPYERVLNPNARDAWTRQPAPLVSEGVAPSTHCRNGHLRTEYTYVDINGALRCRQCRRIYDRERDAKRKAMKR